MTASKSLTHKQQKRRIPFDKSLSPFASHTTKVMNAHYSPVPLPRSPTLSLWRLLSSFDSCTEDMDLLTQMVKSKSQAQLLAISRPTTPAPTTTNAKAVSNSHTIPAN